MAKDQDVDDWVKEDLEATKAATITASSIKKTSNPRAFPIVSSKPTHRIEYIVDLMNAGKWQRGISHVAMAKHFGIAEATAIDDASKAWQFVCMQASRPREMQQHISGILHTNLLKADAMYDGKDKFQSVAKLADTFSRIIGARAPEKIEHSHTVAQFEGMTPEAKLAWLDERIEKLVAMRKEVVAQLPIDVTAEEPSPSDTSLDND